MLMELLRLLRLSGRLGKLGRPPQLSSRVLVLVGRRRLWFGLFLGWSM